MREKRSRPKLTFFVLCLATTAFALMQSFVLPVLPLIQRHYGTSQETVAWVMTAYLLSASIATPILGRYGDIVGKEKVLLICQLALTAGTVVCALAPSIAVLIAGRLIQGVGGAVFALAFGIIRDELPAERVAGAIGTVSALLAAGSGLALVLAGPVVSNLGFHWLFWLPLPPIVGALVATHLFVPESPVRAPGKVTLLPAVALSLWLVTLLLGVSEGPVWGWGSARVIGLLVGFAVALPAWVAIEAKGKNPLIELSMMREPAVFRANLAALLFGAVLYACAVLLPAFMQTSKSAGYGFGLSVTTSGLVQLPNAVATFVMGFLVGRITTRIGSKAVTVVGSLCCAVAYVMYGSVHGDLRVVSACSGLFGIGVALGFSALSTLVVEAVRADQVGAAAGMNSNLRTIGGAIGTTIASVLVTSGVHAGSLPKESGYTHAFLAMALAAVLTVFAALTVPTRKADEPFVQAALRHDGGVLADA
ncbi:MAG TPA: MFS transporter [Mycobacteriales bacterium]|nr:MFS transporter [Mycobacteriales bacterium]